jgi:hypothetical protein
MCHEDLPMRQRSVKSSVLHLGFSSSSELEESSLEKSMSLRAAHAWDIVPLGVVVLHGGGVELLPLGQSAMKWVVSTHSKQPLGDLLLSLRNLCKTQNFLASRAISSSGMLSYCSSEVADKEDKANFKADETVVLMGLAS